MDKIKAVFHTFSKAAEVGDILIFLCNLTTVGWWREQRTIAEDRFVVGRVDIDDRPMKHVHVKLWTAKRHAKKPEEIRVNKIAKDARLADWWPKEKARQAREKAEKEAKEQDELAIVEPFS